MPRARSSGLSEAMALVAPRNLNEPVRWSDSALQMMCAPIRSSTRVDVISGVRWMCGRIRSAAASTSASSMAGPGEDSSVIVERSTRARRLSREATQRASVAHQDGHQETLGTFGPRKLCDERVELGRVIELDHVCEFVDDHVVENPMREVAQAMRDPDRAIDWSA